MKILVAPDSYKGSLSAKEAAIYMEQGIRDVLPHAEVTIIPVADGGEGTVDAIVSAAHGTLHEVEVVGPIGDTVKSFFGVLRDDQTAVIEMAAASGLTLVPAGRLNPMIATTYGTGQLIKHALDYGCRKIVIGIGGSATNDGGVGMAQALGVRFLNEQGTEISFGGGELSKIRRIDISNIDPRVKDCEIRVASDVTNPFCGPHGAAAIYGPQKGATSEMIKQLEHGMVHLSRLIREQLGIEIETVPGAGAAGGLGGGLIAFLSAKIGRGIDMVLETTEFEEIIQQVEIVFTGEGRTDSQTAQGKTAAGIAKIAKKYKKPVICISGSISTDVDSLYELGIDAIVAITQSPMTLEDAMRNAPSLIRQTTASVMRILLIPVKGG
ncbi:glycerate kinase [Paenibacillus sp. P96]|uniref:Glycerate kinase n=1 Tax=Paenibacillus zeirhizosphaerae TaxID=2987519 RepID=A0ABT9FN81_9BACL|nr:glycerate kinase [Paenibacillus sp. P96]MDP4095862.1 glycerate kinase [Paenibacillus sp. P96]